MTVRKLRHCNPTAWSEGLISELAIYDTDLSRNNKSSIVRRGRKIMLHEKIRKKVSILARFKLFEDNELKKSSRRL